MRSWPIVLVVLLGCSGSQKVSPAGSPAGSGHARPPLSGGSPAAVFMGGTSDGTSCEEARDRYVDEIDMQAGSAPDLSAGDLGAVLNTGTYLTPCDVPEASRVQICVAVKNGTPVGVTVALAPSNPDVELCVAKQVRGLAFPPNPKLDIATVHF